MTRPFAWVCMAAVLAGLLPAAGARAFVAMKLSPREPVKLRRTLRADLDGDAAPEAVTLEFGGQHGLEEVMIRCGGDSLFLLGEGISAEASVVDLDTTDLSREILLSEEGPSDDPALAFVAWRGGTLRVLGVIAGETDRSEWPADGSLQTMTRGHVLHTWWYPQEFVLGPGDTLLAVQKNLYPMRTPVTLLVDLPLLAEPAAVRPDFVLQKGAQAILWATDDREWVLVRAGERSGWFRVRDGFTIEPLGLEATSVFDGLLIAD